MRDAQRSLLADNITSTLSETVVLLCSIVLSYAQSAKGLINVVFYRCSTLTHPGTIIQ